MPSQCVVCSAALPVTTASVPSWGCTGCVERLLALLDDIELMAPELDTGRRGATPDGPRRPHYGPRIELDLTVLAFLDPRTVPTDDDPVRSLVGSLYGINNAIREHRGDQVPPEPLLYRETNYLRGVATWCATREDFDEILADVRDLHRSVRLLTRTDRPQPVGRCPIITTGDRPCGTRLEVWPDDPRIECPRCGAHWARAEYLHLAQTVIGYHGHVVRTLIDRRALALLTGRSETTIRRHLTPVKHDPEDGAALYDAVDAVDRLNAIKRRGRRDTPSTVVDTSP